MTVSDSSGVNSILVFSPPIYKGQPQTRKKDISLIDPTNEFSGCTIPTGNMTACPHLSDEQDRIE
jgi:hypothetical protein